MKTPTAVIVTNADLMSDNQITHALKGSEKAEFWVALMQLIDQYRSEYPASAAACAGMNNALGMARDLGAHEALSGLMLELVKRRSG